jgi:hypothetical protein
MILDLKLLVLLLLISAFLSSCGQNANSDRRTYPDEKQPSEYTTSILNSITNLTPQERLRRDTLYKEYKEIRLYKTLFVDKLTKLEYVPIIEGLGYLLTHKVDTVGYEVLIRTKEYAQKLPEKDSLLTYASGIEPLGGYIPEFEDLVNRYISKFGYLGKKGDTVMIDGNLVELPFSYNLSYAKLLIEPANRDALDALGASIGMKISFWNDTSDFLPNRYDFPQFVFRKQYVSYLRSHYPNSKFIPQFENIFTATELIKLYDENELAADKKVKHKRIAVKGKIFSISKDILDEPYVLLETGQILSKVQCDINERVALTLKKGEVRTFVGRCDGLTLQNIFLADCVVLE